jgi:hypothetical protein
VIYKAYTREHEESSSTKIKQNEPTKTIKRKPCKEGAVYSENPEDPQRREKMFELSKKHVPKIYNELKKGKTVLEIFRTGQGKQTGYHVKPIR